MSERGLRSRLARNLVGVALVSVLLLAGVNFVFARLLITESVTGQLAATRDTRTQALERAFARSQSEVSAYASDPSVVEALTGLAAGYEALDEDLTPDQIADLEALYDEELLAPLAGLGVELPTPADFLPDSTAGRYLHQHYIADNPDPFDERQGLDDPGDGSLYSSAHALHHPLLRELKETAALSDLLLIDLASQDVVYSTKKRVDIGTDVVSGPHADTGLGQIVEQIVGVAVGDTVVSDSWFYFPSGGSPVLFLAAAVRSGPEVVGVLVAELPAEVLTTIMTAGGDWDLLGLGETGETYIVGSDQTMRTSSRLWLEDQDEYLDRYVDEYDDQRSADLIAAVGSPVLIQTVDNDAVTTAFDGDEFVGTTTNYLGTKTQSTSAPVQIEGLDWIVVAEQSKSESDEALDSYIRRILLVIAVLVPSIALIGGILARNLTRPASSLVRAADRIAQGDLDTEVEDLGRNELGDLGHQLQGVAQQLEDRERSIREEDQRIDEMLAAVLPARLIERVRSGERSIDDIVDTATIISLTLEDLTDTAADQDAVLEVTEQISDAIDELMAVHEVERIRRSYGSQLFVTGLDDPEPNTAQAARFTIEILDRIAAIGVEIGHELRARAGLSAGEVATGVLGTSQVSFGVWGDPATNAVSLDSLAREGQVLVDTAVVDQLGDGWDIGPAQDLPGLVDDIEAHELRGEVGNSARTR